MTETEFDLIQKGFLLISEQLSAIRDLLKQIVEVVEELERS
jgi:hypothetical protein